MPAEQWSEQVRDTERESARERERHRPDTERESEPGFSQTGGMQYMSSYKPSVFKAKAAFPYLLPSSAALFYKDLKRNLTYILLPSCILAYVEYSA